ncbi:MAG: GntR family transcriptional regulator [Anaerococcus sp.]|nr:GntR family transcriptional regulator [Anaerococcus sp.]
MKYRSKEEKAIDFIALEILKGRLKDKDKLYDIKFFTNKFKLSPRCVKAIFKTLEERKMLEKIGDEYYLRVDDKLMKSLRERFYNRYINEFLENMRGLDLGLGEAIGLLEMRNKSNG